MIRTPFTDLFGVSEEVARLEKEGRPFEEVAHLVRGARGLEGLVNGDTEHGIWWAGLVQGLIHDEPTVAELVKRLITEAQGIISERLTHMLHEPRRAT